MRWPSLGKWIGRTADQAPPAVSRKRAVEVAQAEDVAVQDRPEVWPAERLSVTDALWGDGFQIPGGELEILRLARPLGLSAASSLLLIGAGSGGAPCCVASHLGVWVTGFETDSDLAALGNERSIRTGLGRRAQIESWDPHAPEFGRSYFHHALALDPLRDGNHELVLAAATVALKPGGQITVVDNAADTPLDLADPDVRAWTRRASREPDSVPTQANVTRILTRLGFDVRIVEDVSHRHVQQALFGWRQVVGDLEDLKPTARQAMPLVREAELWLLQLRLFRGNKMRRVRWHAIGRGSV